MAESISEMTSTEDESQIDHEEEAFFSYFRQSKLPEPSSWPESSPIYVCASARAPHIRYGIESRGNKDNNSPPPPFPLDGTLVDFDGPLFKGFIVSRIKNAPSMNSVVDADPGKSPRCSKDFEKKSRLFQWTVQGVFKKRMRFDEVSTGQDFGRPFRNAPSTTIVKKALDLLRNKLPDSFECDLFGERPKFEHPLIAGCQKFRVDRISELEKVVEDRLVGETEYGVIEEDTSLLGNDVPNTSEKRRRFFSKNENLRQYYFETKYLYTFDFCSNFFSPPNYRLKIAPFLEFNLTSYFNGYPLFMAMAKEKESGEYIFATEMWHHLLLDYEKATAKPPSGFRRFNLVSRRSKSKKDEELLRNRKRPIGSL